MPVPEQARLAALLLPAVWLGFVLAISFMEAPLKFRAPGVSRDAALSIGRLVFQALARVELTLWLLEALSLWAAGWPGGAHVWFTVLTLLLSLQQGWLLPRLDRRATAVLAGHPVAPSRLHVLYVGAECAKVLALPALCWSLGRSPIGGL